VDGAAWSGERCKLSQQGQGRSLGRQHILGVQERRKWLKLKDGERILPPRCFFSMGGGGDRPLASGIDASGYLSKPEGVAVVTGTMTHSDSSSQSDAFLRKCSFLL